MDSGNPGYRTPLVRCGSLCSYKEIARAIVLNSINNRKEKRDAAKFRDEIEKERILTQWNVEKHKMQEHKLRSFFERLSKRMVTQFINGS